MVAATLSSGPALRGTTASARRATGEVSSLTRAITKAPAALAPSMAPIRSGLLPDWDMARHATPAMSGVALKRELIEGAAEEVRMLRRVSIRYWAKVAAWSELPRPIVTTARGCMVRSRTPRSAIIL